MKEQIHEILMNLNRGRIAVSESCELIMNLLEATTSNPPIWLDGNTSFIAGRMWDLGTDGDERRIKSVELIQNTAKEFGYELTVSNSIVIIKNYCSKTLNP